MSSENFPDFIEHWNPDMFYKAGYAMTFLTAGVNYMAGFCQETIVLNGLVIAYWVRGHADMEQKTHALLRNYPVLGNFRFLFEMIRPEIRQYFIEGDDDGRPFDRNHRSIVYQRSKYVPETIPFGTRRDTYEVGYEFARHSLYPKQVDMSKSRVTIGGSACKKPYSASLLNVSAMSYGALSDNAIKALSAGAKMGGFYHNTGEGGVSRFHIEGGADLVWNIGTGYFGCRHAKDGTFSPEIFKNTLTKFPTIKMIEIKLSQGAKPGHGGLLPAAKLTPFIAEARGVPLGTDCHSPPNHSAFTGPHGLVKFISQLRELSDGLPIGFKICIGQREEFAAIVHAMLAADVYPDFITVDGGEGGTGAAPPEFSNSVGMPLVDGLTLVNNILIGAGVRDRMKIICAGKVSSGFSIVRNLALGADLCNAARAMMFSLGCIQALKCNSNKCPTGVTSLDPVLMNGLDPTVKSVRVRNFQHKTVESCLDIIGAMGHTNPADIEPRDVMKRVAINKVETFENLYPTPDEGSLLTGNGPAELQAIWKRGAVQLIKAISTDSMQNGTNEKILNNTSNKTALLGGTDKNFLSLESLIKDVGLGANMKVEDMNQTQFISMLSSTSPTLRSQLAKSMGISEQQLQSILDVSSGSARDDKKAFELYKKIVSGKNEAAVGVAHPDGNSTTANASINDASIDMDQSSKEKVSSVKTIDTVELDTFNSESSTENRTAIGTVEEAQEVSSESGSLLPVSSPLPARTEIYVGDLDLEDEIVSLVNPTGEDRDLSGYRIADQSEKHVYTIPDGIIMKGNSTLHVYCDSKKATDPKEPFIYWLNKNGKPRRAPVLNNEGDEINLYDKDGNIVSRCRKQEDSTAIYARN